MFTFDEREINDRFGRRLDGMLPIIASRSAGFQPTTWPVLFWLSLLAKLRPFRVESAEGDMKITLDGRLIGNEDAIKLVTQQLLDAIMVWIMRQRAEVGLPLTVWPLKFEYDEGMLVIDNELRFGEEVVVTTTVEWSPLG